jgi:hypothetical protein
VHRGFSWWEELRGFVVGFLCAWWHVLVWMERCWNQWGKCYIVVGFLSLFKIESQTVFSSQWNCNFLCTEFSDNLFLFSCFLIDKSIQTERKGMELDSM